MKLLCLPNYSFKGNFIAVLILYLFSSYASAVTVCTPAVGVCDYEEIQTAINNAVDGDIIEISAEIFSEGITIDKDLTLIGEGEADTSIMYGGGSVVTVLPNATVYIQDLAITNGIADQGGGVHNSGDLTMYQVTVASNFAFSQGGGIWTESTLFLEDVTVSGNAVDNAQDAEGGGGIYIGFEGWLVDPLDVTIKRGDINNNIACKGGGIYHSKGHVEIIKTTISDNSAGEYCQVDPFLDNGGGIYAAGLYEDSILKIRRSTISDNTTTDMGGAIAVMFGSIVTLTSSTLSGNEAGTAGAIGSYAYTPLLPNTIVLNNVTVTNNTAENPGGIFADEYTTVTVRNSIVADNIATSPFGNTDCLAIQVVGGGVGTIISEGNNIESAGDCSFSNVGDLQFVSPALFALANNGGPTETHAIPDNGLAHDMGNQLGCDTDVDGDGILDGTLLKDQRGAVRVGTCDIGAFERQ